MISLSATGSLLICITLFFWSVKEKKKRSWESSVISNVTKKNPSLCIHSFTGWLKTFSFLLPIKENIKTNYGLSSLSWNGWKALGFLSATSWEWCPMAAEHIHQHPAKGMVWRWDQERAEQDWAWQNPAWTLANSMHLETQSFPFYPFLSCVFLCIEWAVIAYFLKWIFSSIEDPTFP